MDECMRLQEIITRQAERVRELEADNRQLVTALIKTLTVLDQATRPIAIIGSPDSTTPGFSFTDTLESIRRAAQRMGRE